MEVVDCSCSSNYLNADPLRTFTTFLCTSAAQPAWPPGPEANLPHRCTSWRMRGGQQQLCIKCLQSLARFVCPYPGQDNVAFATHRFAFVKSKPTSRSCHMAWVGLLYPQSFVRRRSACKQVKRSCACRFLGGSSLTPFANPLWWQPGNPHAGRRICFLRFLARCLRFSSLSLAFLRQRRQLLLDYKTSQS